MTVKTSPGQDYLVRLYGAGHLTLSVYIHGGRTETFKVPLGTFELKFASGTQWQDYWEFFGPSTAYAKADDTFTFDRNTGKLECDPLHRAGRQPRHVTHPRQ